MSTIPILEDRFVLGVDVESYSPRNIRRQFGLQRDLNAILDAAADASGLSRAEWIRQPGGDGELALLPHGVDLVAVVRRFPAALEESLQDFNDDHAAETRLRLRVAMHIDVVAPAALGFAGPALIVLSRLLDARETRAALSGAPHAALALVLSEAVFRKVVASELGGLRPAQFTSVAIDRPEKAFKETAYIQVRGDVRATADS